MLGYCAGTEANGAILLLFLCASLEWVGTASFISGSAIFTLQQVDAILTLQQVDAILRTLPLPVEADEPPLSPFSFPFLFFYSFNFFFFSPPQKGDIFALSLCLTPKHQYLLEGNVYTHLVP